MSPRRPYAYVAVGLVGGLAYAFLNTQTDDWARTDWARAEFARGFFAFHAFVDRGIPVLAGALFGLAVHWLYLRSRLAQELRSRLNHVERDQAVWVVAASTLHELKNPLHAMGLLVDELGEISQGGDPAAIEAQVARVRVQMDRALLPLDALRSLTRRGQPQRERRPIGPIAQEIVDALRPVARDAGIELRLEGDRHADVPVDPELVRIIVDNLIANALEGEGRAVEVRITDESSRVVLRVSDDGPGLSAERRATLFEPLHTDKSNGLGLGLPIARALARTLGGDLVTAESAAGFRTAFELVVPTEAR